MLLTTPSPRTWARFCKPFRTNMKRSFEETASGSAETAPPSAIKRATSEADGGGEEGETSAKSFLLVSQNRSLNRELQRNKRTIAEARKELELMRRKSREMESLVSLIQRAWSQLDIDTSMLLDSLGDSEAHVSDEGSSELLHRLVNAGMRYMKVDPTNADSISRLSADQWTSAQDVEKQRQQLQTELKDEKEHHSNRSESITEEDLNERYGGTVDENLAAHVSFTLSLLERLCNAINDSGGATLQVDTVNALNEMRELRAEKLVLSDRITKLTSELIDLSAKLRIAETERLRAEREVDRAVLAAKEAALQPVKTENADGAMAVEGAVDASGAPLQMPSSPQPSNPSVEKELRRQVAILERQLAESETSKAQVEMTLTERLARPLPQTEVQVADMRNAMEELRQQCKHRVSALLSEGDVLQDKVRNLELALSHLEAISAARIDEVITLTQKEIAAVRAEKEGIQSTLCAAQTDLALCEQMKTQIAEYQGMEELCNSEVQKLQARVKSLTETQEVLQSSLDSSRAREAELQAALQATTAQPSTGAETAGGETGNDTSGEVSREQLQLLLSVSQSRVAELQRELANSSNNINDLIMEIETVSGEEAKARSQGARLQKQIAECQGMQRVALEENLHLQNHIEDLKMNQKDIETRVELMKGIMLQQEAVISQLRNAEQTVRTEYQGVKKSSMQVQGNRHVDEQKLLEARQQLADTEHSVKSALKRNQELQARCDELSRQCEVERKAKMETQRDLSKLKGAKKDNKGAAGGSAGSAAAAGGASMNPEDADMLEMTLGMLRCSVCKDRFKSCAITRCFHLFCKECIDENLRNRSRKCPACGEKFGQDDVTPVYFN